MINNILDNFQLYNQYQKDGYNQFLDWTKIYNFTNQQLTENFVALEDLSDIDKVRRSSLDLLAGSYLGVQRKDFLAAIGGTIWDISKWDEAIWLDTGSSYLWTDGVYKKVAKQVALRKRPYSTKPTPVEGYSFMTLQLFEDMIAEFCNSPFYLRRPNQLQQTNLYYYGAGNPNNTTDIVPAGWDVTEPDVDSYTFTLFIITTNPADYFRVFSVLDSIPLPNYLTIKLKGAQL